MEFLVSQLCFRICYSALYYKSYMMTNLWTIVYIYENHQSLAPFHTVPIPVPWETFFMLHQVIGSNLKQINLKVFNGGETIVKADPKN